MANPRPTTLSALTGIAARRALKLYLVSVAMVMLLLLLVAWAIDLSSNMDDIGSRALQTGAATHEVLFPYLAYRAADIVTRLFPVACLLGAFLAELLRRYRLETIILATAGWSPIQGIASVVAFGALAGLLQAQLEARWRPDAVFAQVELGVGQYATRFHRGALDEPQWLMGRDFALRALMVRDPVPELRQIELYRGYASGVLESVWIADRAAPSAQQNVWNFEGVLACDLVQGPLCRRLSRATVALELSPEQVTFFDIPAFYLPAEALGELARQHPQSNSGDVWTAVWRRRLSGLVPFAFALLGASLSQMVWSGRAQSPAAIVAAGFFGYCAIVSLKVFWSLGEMGHVPAALAASLPVGLALAGSSAIQFVRSRGGWAQKRIFAARRAATMRG